jgi:signal transduction histidine kinase
MPPTPPMPSWIEELAQALVRPRARQELARVVDSLPLHAGMRLDRRLVDLARVADDAVAAARAVHPDRDYWVFHEPPALPVLGDPRRLREAIEVLVSAAAAASRPGRRVAVRSRLERRAGGQRATIEIEGEEDGVAAEPEARSLEAGPSACESTGAGVELCREIARLHGGSLELEAGRGRTRFRMGIPLRAGPREGSAA